MKLEEYLTTIETNAGLARILGVAPSLVSQWRNGVRPIPFERCAEIEAATNGLVSRIDLCPDNWQKLWPELLSQSDKCACRHDQNS